MKFIQSFISIIVISIIVIFPISVSAKDILSFKLKNGSFIFIKNEKSGWGIALENDNNNTFKQLNPVQILIYTDSLHIENENHPYRQIKAINNNNVLAETEITVSGAKLKITDNWVKSENGLMVHRSLKVSGDDNRSFSTSLSFPFVKPLSINDVQYFIPGIIYGSTNGLPKNAFFENKDVKSIYIREDRCSTPLIGAYMTDGSSLTLINALPNGKTSKADAETTKTLDMCDHIFDFGSVFTTEKNNAVSIGYNFPGNEGEITYADWGYPDWQKKIQKWRYRTLPLKNNLTKEFTIILRFGEEKKYSDFYSNTWRQVFDMYNPKVNIQNIENCKKASLQMLSSKVNNGKFGYGIPNWISGPKGIETPVEDNQTTLGFTGKILETANFLLYASDEYPEYREIFKKQAEGLIKNIIQKLPVSPPIAEGFDLNNGNLVLALRHEDWFYLRTYSDDMKAMMRAILYERKKGIEHPDWLKWVKDYADWLISQQYAEGGFPRNWNAKTGKVNNPSPQSSYNAIPMLVLLYKATNDVKYLNSALKAGEFCLKNQSNGLFIGGTIDNPNATDKEAAALSLEAYLSLYELTKQKKWLNAAELAAVFEATWMYTWNVPMPDNSNAALLHWKENVSTVGFGLISTGHSLVDAYSAFEVDEFAKLYQYTKKDLYLKIAKILLHNTLGMMAIKDRMYDFNEAGYQQEHWSFAPLRGMGHNRGWLPWVSCCHLNGIYGLQQFSPTLYKKLTN